MTFEKLQDVLSHENDKVRDLGKKFQTYQTALDQHRLSQDEFEELVEDLTDLSQIYKQAETMQEKILLEKTMKFIKSFVQSVSG